MTLRPLIQLPAATDKVEESQEKGKILSVGEPKRFHALVNKGNKNVEDVFPPTIQKGDNFHWVSFGGWSMYHLISYVLKTTGPAHLLFSTWAISEQSARSLVLWKESGQLLSISGILDIRARTRHEGAYHLIHGHCNHLVLAHCHAKIAVIYNQDWHITILGSANFTENPRIEAGILTSNDEVGVFHQNWLNNQINEHL